MAYSGLVTLRITGLAVTTPGESAQDAFYQVNPKDTSMPANACAECVRYGRVGDRDCLYGNPTGSVCLIECGAGATYRFADLIVGSYPTFRPSHDYIVTLDLGKSPARLRIGIADCGCSDNSGAYAIELTPVVDSSTCNP